MLNASIEELVRKLLKTTKRVDVTLARLKNVAVEINARYEPRAEFNRWRNSQDGQLWKQQQYQAQKGRCAICQQFIQLKGSHIDHIKPLSRYPHLALDARNLQIACPECNASKNNKSEELPRRSPRS